VSFEKNDATIDNQYVVLVIVVGRNTTPQNWFDVRIAPTYKTHVQTLFYLMRDFFVSYNPHILVCYGGHVNIQCCKKKNKFGQVFA